MSTRIMTAAVIRQQDDPATLAAIVQAEIERLNAHDAANLAKLISAQNARIERLETSRNRLLAEKMRRTHKRTSKPRRAVKRVRNVLDVAWAFLYAVIGGWAFGDLISDRLKAFTLITLSTGFAIIAGCVIYACTV